MRRHPRTDSSNGVSETLPFVNARHQVQKNGRLRVTQIWSGRDPMKVGSLRHSGSSVYFRNVPDPDIPPLPILQRSAVNDLIRDCLRHDAQEPSQGATKDSRRAVPCPVTSAFSMILKKWLPSVDRSVGAKARVIPEDLPVADACLKMDGPKPHRYRKRRRGFVLGHPEDHRRAVTRRALDRKPVAAQRCFRHDGRHLTGP